MPQEKNQSSKNSTSSYKGERIAKRLARVGLCSRREAEALIGQGRVCVDGAVLTSPAFNVTEDQKITVDGRPIKDKEEARVWRYHKPAGVLTTTRDPQGRPTIFERLPPEMPRVISVGRLDFNTEGLLLLTNDGALARHLELPANAWLRHYRVRVYGDIDDAKLASVAKGVTISGIHYDKVKIEREPGKEGSSNHWLAVTIREGKNREVRKIMEFLGLQVTRLIRVAFGPFPLGKLPRGHVEEVPRRVLRDSLGKFFKE
ncbi:MAG: pseudouridine synthase [Alphaproteobacteria bacterium]|nr:pseudouridine synthase [Alphaproteobacteria bacterium]